MDRDEGGKWRKGVSGNPRGRPRKQPSLAAELDARARAEAGAILAAMIERALAGDAECARLVLSRADVAAEGAR